MHDNPDQLTGNLLNDRLKADAVCRTNPTQFDVRSVLLNLERDAHYTGWDVGRPMELYQIDVDSTNRDVRTVKLTRLTAALHHLCENELHGEVPPAMDMLAGSLLRRPRAVLADTTGDWAFHGIALRAECWGLDADDLDSPEEGVTHSTIRQHPKRKKIRVVMFHSVNSEFWNVVRTEGDKPMYQFCGPDEPPSFGGGMADALAKLTLAVTP